MILINPVQVILWTFRRNAHDVVNLYNSLSPVMQLATGGDMLNFGYWKAASEPLAAQRKLCSMVGNIAELQAARRVIDVGSGLSAPAMHWKSMYESLDINCVNINYKQLLLVSKSIQSIANTDSGSVSLQQVNEISLTNATSTSLPFSDHSMDRIIALESAQHFKPLDRFVKESRRILKPDGLLVMAIPVIKTRSLTALFKLGILSLTWSSEHYGLDYVRSTIVNNGFKIADTVNIGKHVYEPLTDYYVSNRKTIKERILKEYPSFLEKILYMSLLKMKDVSQRGIIDYVIIKCMPSIQ